MLFILGNSVCFVFPSIHIFIFCLFCSRCCNFCGQHFRITTRLKTHLANIHNLKFAADDCGGIRQGVHAELRDLQYTVVAPAKNLFPNVARLEFTRRAICSSTRRAMDDSHLFITESKAVLPVPVAVLNVDKWIKQSELDQQSVGCDGTGSDLVVTSP